MRKLALASFLALSLPLYAQAVDTSQIQALLDQINQLRQLILSSQKSAGTSQTVQSGGDKDTGIKGTPQAVRACTPPTRFLKQGLEGDDVANLQIFLARDREIYPEGLVTGYFGPATERALKRFQSKYGIVAGGNPETTGWGVANKTTLTFIASLWDCGGPIKAGWFIASPNHGSSPLRVLFSAQTASFRPLGVSFNIDFGDGNSSQAVISNSVCTQIGGPCSSIISASHVYKSTGSYKAKLSMTRVEHTCTILSQKCPGTASGYCPGAQPICTSNKVSTATGDTTVAVGTASQTTNISGQPATMLVREPTASTTVQVGGAVSITWLSTNAEGGSSVTLSLEKAASGSSLGSIVSGKNASGSYFWTLPSPQGACTGPAISCIGDIGSNSSGGISAVDAGAYRIRADLILGNSIITWGKSAAFAVGAAGQAELATLPSSLLVPTNSSSNTSATTTYNPQNFGSNGFGQSCLYSGVSYADGISLVVNCADLTTPGGTCGAFNGMQLICKNGAWINQATGQPANLPAIITNPGTIQGGCHTPWQNTPVAPNQQVPYEPYFTNGVFTGMSPLPLMMCVNSQNSASEGRWMKCDSIGANCVPWTP